MSKISWFVIGGIGLGIVIWLGVSFWSQSIVEAPMDAFESGQPSGWTEPTEGPSNLIPGEPLPSN